MMDDDEAPQLVDDEQAAQIASHAAASANPAAASSDDDSAAKAADATSPPPTEQAQPPVPLTILTGWLGAGKTTLLTRILDHFGSKGQRVAIIQNEASALGVEAELPTAALDSTSALGDLLELSNGCVCCSVKSDFVMGVEELLRRRRFDYIVLECSGLADPGPLASLFWVDPELESGVYLDGIVCVVDARNLPRNLQSEHEMESRQVIHQIAYGDRIVLNKMDLVTESEKQQCTRDIRNINAAPIYCTTRSEVNIDDILNIKAFDVNDTSRAVMPPLEPVSDASASSAAAAASDAHPHDVSITTFVLDDLDSAPEHRRAVDLARLKLWLEQLLWQDAIEKSEAEKEASAQSPQPPRANEIFRLKAIMAVSGQSQPTFLQGVQQLYDLQPGSTWPIPPSKTAKKNVTSSDSSKQTSEEQPPAPFTRFVFIGRRLDHEALRAGWQTIFVD